MRRLLRKLGIGARYEIPSRATWEREYQDGAWDYLRSDEEMPRYAVIATYLRQHCSGAGLLDAGCGEGVLCDHLWPGSYSDYLGIDFSAQAITRANARPRPNASFDCADISSYVPVGGRSFNAIIFNEVLYCTADPMAVVTHWTRFLTAEGVMIASIYSPWLKAMRPCTDKLEADAGWTEEFGVRHQRSGRSWVIKIWGRPRRLPQQPGDLRT